MNKKRVLLPCTTGVEEIECCNIVDILRRADVNVCLASLDGHRVTGRSGIGIHADAKLSDVQDEDWDMVVLAGGLPNAHLLRDSSEVRALLHRMQQQERYIAAICAAPLALAAAGVIGAHRFTCYPSCDIEILQKQVEAQYVAEEAVVHDGKCITSQGPATAMAFALKLVAILCGEAKATQIQHELLF